MERRKYERFEIGLPARIETVFANKKRMFDVVTKDISATGAFVSTNSTLVEGMPVKMSMATQSEKIAEITGSQSLIECEGRIVRTTPTGSAICFNEECKVIRLNEL
jgi:hypothetical protein